MAVLHAVTRAPGADLMVTTDAGQSLLHLLAEHLRGNVLPILLELGERLLGKARAAGLALDAAAGKEHWTPLHTAVKSHSPFGRVLIAAGADVK